MLCYTGLAAEFLFRVYYRKPFQRGDAPESPEAPNDKSWRAEGGYLPFRISLMVLGLAIATVFVFVRFVVSFLSFIIYPPRSSMYPLLSGPSTVPLSFSVDGTGISLGLKCSLQSLMVLRSPSPCCHSTFFPRHSCFASMGKKRLLHRVKIQQRTHTCWTSPCSAFMEYLMP